jgi:hypothetical protein
MDQEDRLKAAQFPNISEEKIEAMYRMGDFIDRALEYGDQVLEGGYNPQEAQQFREDLHREWDNLLGFRTVDAVFQQILEGEQTDQQPQTYGEFIRQLNNQQQNRDFRY